MRKNAICKSKLLRLRRWSEVSQSYLGKEQLNYGKLRNDGQEYGYIIELILREGFLSPRNVFSYVITLQRGIPCWGCTHDSGDNINPQPPVVTWTRHDKNVRDTSWWFTDSSGKSISTSMANLDEARQKCSSNENQIDGWSDQSRMPEHLITKYVYSTYLPAYLASTFMYVRTYICICVFFENQPCQ